MGNKWKVCSRFFGFSGEKIYQVYRLKDVSQPDTEENREYALSQWVFSYDEAWRACQRLNLPSVPSTSFLESAVMK